MSYDTYIRDLQNKTQNLTAINTLSVLGGDLLVGNGVFSSYLSSTTASFVEITSNSFYGPTGTFDNLTANTFYAPTGSFGSLTANSFYGPTGTFGNLTANSIYAPTGSFASLTANTFYTPTGSFGSLTATNASISSLDVSGNTTMANVSTSSLTSTSASITSLSVGGVDVIPNQYFSTIVLNGSNTSLTLPLPSTARRISLMLQDFKTNGTNNPGIYLTCNTGTPLCSGLTIGTQSSGRATFGPSVPARLWNTTWAATNLLNMSVEISLADIGASNANYILTAHGFLNNATINYSGIYGYLTIPNNAALTGVVITSGGVNLLSSGFIYTSYN